MWWSAFSFPVYLTPKSSTTREKYWLGAVIPERRSSGHRGEAELVEVSFESVVGNAASLLEAGHAFSDIKVDPDVGTERTEAVLFNDFVWDAG